MPAPTTVAPAGPTLDPDTEIAKRHFQAGTSFYEAGDYPHALTEFKAASRVKPHPAFSYNIGRCEDRLEHWKEAMDAYQRYLAEMPDAPDAPDVRRRVGELEYRISRNEVPAPLPQGAIVQSSSEPPTASALRPYALPISGAGLSLVSLITGIALSATVAPEYDNLKSFCGPNCPNYLVSPLQDRTNAGYALIAVGAALAAVDVGLWIYAWRKAPKSQPIILSPSAGGAVSSGGF